MILCFISGATSFFSSTSFLEFFKLFVLHSKFESDSLGVPFLSDFDFKQDNNHRQRQADSRRKDGQHQLISRREPPFHHTHSGAEGRGSHVFAQDGGRGEGRIPLVREGRIEMRSRREPAERPEDVLSAYDMMVRRVRR